MFHRIRYESRYYNRSGGLDHLVVYATDNGPLCDCVDKSYYSLALGIDHQPLVKRMLSRMIKIGYYGQRGALHAASGHAHVRADAPQPDA